MREHALQELQKLVVIHPNLQSHMISNRILAVCVLAAVGCTPATDNNNKAREAHKEDSARSELTVDSESLPPRITNQFGMTFRLVEIDTSRPDQKVSFPKRSYYLQETELTGDQHTAFHKAAAGSGVFELIGPRYRGVFPSEWREAVHYAEALSRFDPKYDYGLPSRSQWTFACMGGYEQRCDKEKPNAYGIADMLDEDCEAIDEMSIETVLEHDHEYGILMGRWKNNWGEHTGKPKPDCPCEYWARCNPDADDSLNELIVARFILIPKGFAPPDDEDQ